MDKSFLIVSDKQYSYDDLLKSVNQKENYIKALLTSNIYEFWVNLIVALLQNQNLTLIDSDISETETNTLGLESEINDSEFIKEKIQIFSLDDMIDKIIISKSIITIFTSGTTGQPKRVEHTFESLTKTIQVSENKINNIWGYAYNPTHMAGLQVFLEAFLNKNSIVNFWKESQKDILGYIEYYKITHISATPTFYRLLLPTNKTYDSVARITLGGERSTLQLLMMIKSSFINAKINNVYASSEAGSLFASKGEYFRIPLYLKEKIKIIDSELLIHKSLLGKSDTLELNNDFYHTGDIIEWKDETEGLFTFMSRKNELINVGGYKINPAEVEDAILEMNFVKQTIVYGKPNSVLGNILCCDVEPLSDKTITEMEIRQHLKNKIQDFKIPRKINIVSSLSITRTGKIKRT